MDSASRDDDDIDDVWGEECGACVRAWKKEGWVKLPLNLSHLKLRTLFDRQVAMLKAIGVKNLFLPGNRFVSFPESMSQLTDVWHLNLEDNMMVSFPETVCLLANLTSLYLSNNQLSSLHADLGKLENLEILVLNNNMFSSVPEEVLQLTTLRKLSMTGNRLSSIPETIDKLVHLTSLYLTNNALTSVPGSLWRIESLGALRLDFNDLDAHELCGIAMRMTHNKIVHQLLINDCPGSGAPEVMASIVRALLTNSSLTSCSVETRDGEPDGEIKDALERNAQGKIREK